MDFEKRFKKWTQQLQTGKENVEAIYITADTCLFADENGRQDPDRVYFRLLQDGKITEFDWTKNFTKGPYPVCRFLIKDEKRILFAKQGPEQVEFYGFGLGDTSKDQSILLYIRSAYGADLYFSDATSDTVSKMYGIEEDNPAALDSLIRYILANKNIVNADEED